MGAFIGSAPYVNPGDILVGKVLTPKGEVYQPPEEKTALRAIFGEKAVMFVTYSCQGSETLRGGGPGMRQCASYTREQGMNLPPGANMVVRRS